MKYSIENGLKADAVKAVEELIKKENSMDIINDRLIPALDSVGGLFD